MHKLKHGPAGVVGGVLRGDGRGPCRSPVQQTTRSNNCRFSEGRYCDMMADVFDDETIALRATVIERNGYPDDYEPAAAGPARDSPALHPTPADSAGGVGQLGAAGTVPAFLQGN